MRKITIILSILITSIVFSQDQLAQNYFDKGDFEKAIISYDELLKNQPSNSNYFQKTIECLQQIKQLDKAEVNIKERLDKYKQSNLLVELGYNYRLKKDESNAKKYFDQAIDKIKKTPTEVYAIANVFEKKIVLDYALLAYQTASQIDSTPPPPTAQHPHGKTCSATTPWFSRSGKSNKRTQQTNR